MRLRVLAAEAGCACSALLPKSAQEARRVAACARSLYKPARMAQGVRAWPPSRPLQVLRARTQTASGRP